MSTRMLTADEMAEMVRGFQPYEQCILLDFPVLYPRFLVVLNQVDKNHVRILV